MKINILHVKKRTFSTEKRAEASFEIIKTTVEVEILNKKQEKLTFLMIKNIQDPKNPSQIFSNFHLSPCSDFFLENLPDLNYLDLDGSSEPSDDFSRFFVEKL